METLIKKYDNPNRWYPHTVENYKNSIIIPSDTDDNRRLNSNFAYSMQYIEYLEKQINELRLSNVILTMIYKSYIITGMSIIELLFVYLLKKTGNWNHTEWKEKCILISNPIKTDGNSMKSETHLYTKVPAFEMRMDFDAMIKRIEQKHIISIEHNAFPVLKKLRALRNKVHLQSGESAYDHDYNNFGFKEIQSMRIILYKILTAPEICNYRATFDFIIDAYNRGVHISD